MSAHRLFSLSASRWSHSWLRHRWSSSSSNVEMFDKLLIANRGEIACRVMKTAHRLGVKTVAVYSEADRNAMHVAMANEAYCIGPAPSSESYLRQDKIMDVAKTTGAQAIHPGYGFLSENKNFAQLCHDEGVEFVGPPPSAIEKMGIKRLSKSIMSASSVPIVPGYFGEDQSDQRLREEADKIGYPVMIKADLGGGGKGMRIVHTGNEFQDALNACRSEATKSFGDDKVLIEKFVDRPRHVEIQVFADKQGNTVHLFERDCSVQRRHQKIIEEAPAPGLRQGVREEICLAAVRAAQAVSYVGAGTVEFILDSNQDFYFMEMNTRLQVEHPVTEMITGADLVEWQLQVAAGAPLPKLQTELTCRGHAFEARIYAENPEMGFIPSPGYLHHLVPPQGTDTVRIDTGVKQGDEVSTYYDPMIAKLVVWSKDRLSALNKLRDSLLHYQVAGVNTNIGFLGRLSAHPKFQEGDVHTGFIEQHEAELFPSDEQLSEEAMMEGALVLLALEKRASPNSDNDPFSPFSSCSGDRLNVQSGRKISLNHGDKEFQVDVLYLENGSYQLSQPNSNENITASCQLSKDSHGNLRLRGVLGDRQVSADIAVVDNSLHIFTGAGSFKIEVPKPSFVKLREKGADGETRSPKYPSTATKLFVKPGDSVKKGDILMTVEGMKMETNIQAVKDGVIQTVFYHEKDTVPAFSKVVEYKEEDS